MEDVRTLGVPASPDGVPCQPNVILDFLENGHRKIERLARKNYKFLEELTADDMRELKRQHGPVQAVKLTALERA
jgi:hypothetical protein